MALEAALAEARRGAEEAEAGAETARQRLADARAAAAAWKAGCDAHDVAARAYDDQRRRRDAAAEQLRELEERAAGLRASSAEEPTIAAELEHKRSRLAQADQGIQASTAAVVAAREALADALAELEGQRSALQGRLDTATAKLADLETRIRNNEAVLAERPAIETAVAEPARLQEEEQAARRDAAQADSDARVAARQGEEALRAGTAQRARALQERARVERLRLALSRAEEVEAAARCLPGLRRDVEAAETEIASAERVLEELRGRRLAGADERIAGLREGLERVVGAERAAPGARTATALQIATETLDTDDAARRAAAEVPEAITLAAARVARARERAQKARAALQETEALAALAERLDADRAALAEAVQAAVAADGAVAEAEQARAAAVRQAATYRGARDGYLERAAVLAAQAAELRALAAKAARLAADLGRDGLQAAEIDAAGPELTELVNDLLHRCLGPRFTVSIETQRLSADGKRTLEGCEVKVLDVERGRDTTAETLSGGEAVLVGEAVSLALATLACRRAGGERPSLVRDESGAALSPENARVYVSMLRRAAELIDADKVLLVSHTPEVWDLCDARIEIGAGS